jgi:flagellar P-ring protein precursor FlgI
MNANNNNTVMGNIGRLALGILLVGLLTVSGTASAERVKDLANVSGVRSNQLVGYGLVVGLNGTGDQTSQTPFTVQSIKSMLAQFGVSLPSGTSLQLKNVAAVTISAELPPFAKAGQTIDVNVQSIGNAKSLRGGTLLMTPLKGADGRVYAIAQGNLIVGGFGASGSDGSSITVNIPSAGRIPNGASVERTVASAFGQGNSLTLDLNSPDFTTATRLAKAVNRAFGPGTAHPMDASSVRINAPANRSQRVSFISMLENLTLDPGEAAAKVIVNSRTGTVVIGRHVRVLPAAVSHGNLTVTITEQPNVSQPAPFSGGTTQVVPQSNVQITQEKNRMFKFAPGTTLDEIVRAVNQVGAAPGDLVAILEALRSAGALRAELEVI